MRWGATDAIADIVGTCIGLDWLDIDRIYCSPLPTGGGTVWAAHGRLPVPVPAVLHLFKLRQVPLYSNGIEKELVTPTGAAIATTLATDFGPPPAMTLRTLGLGAGNQNLRLPNILRLWLGDTTAFPQSQAAVFPKTSQTVSKIASQIASQTASTAPPSFQPSGQPESQSKLPSGTVTVPKTETIAILETQLDDLNPQIVGYLFEQLLQGGALDVFTQAVGMKKSRPGLLLTVICLPEQMEACEQIIYRETPTLGIRRRCQERSLLHREFRTVVTPYGEVRIKIASMQPGTAVINVKPEYDDCVRLAQQHQVAWTEVYQAALRQWDASLHRAGQEAG